MKKLIVLFLVFMLFATSAQAYVTSEWANEEFNMALEYGTLTDSELMQDYTENITREMMCKFIIMTYEKFSGTDDLDTDNKSPFDDCDDESVKKAYLLNIVSGRDEHTFDPDSFITRQEYAIMLTNLEKTLDIYEEIGEEEKVSCVENISDYDAISDWAKDAVINVIIKGYMVGDEGEFSPTGLVTGEQAVILSMRFFTKNTEGFFSFDIDENTILENSYKVPDYDETLYEYNGSYKKNDESEVFTEGKIEDEEFAKTQMTDITIDVWTIDSKGDKKASKKTLTVNKNIADKVKIVFDEIFNGEEKFPIKSVGGYAWRVPKSSGRLSEHNYGTAIDINPNENYCVYSDGSTSGSFWDPDSSPYSIRKFGDVWNAFVRHGFTWGGDAWKTPQDYMHFSYLGR